MVTGWTIIKILHFTHIACIGRVFLLPPPPLLISRVSWSLNNYNNKNNCGQWNAWGALTKFMSLFWPPKISTDRRTKIERARASETSKSQATCLWWGAKEFRRSINSFNYIIIVQSCNSENRNLDIMLANDILMPMPIHLYCLLFIPMARSSPFPNCIMITS